MRRLAMLLDDAQRDLQYAARTLGRAPGFTAVAVVTLALGIGANTAIFSVVNAVLLRPLPYKNPDRLVRIFGNIPAAETSSGPARRVPGVTVADLAPLRAQTQTLSHVALYVGMSATLSGRDGAVKLEGVRVSPETFPMLGAQPQIGRAFESREAVAGADAVVILSHAAWQRHFGGASDVLGQSLHP